MVHFDGDPAFDASPAQAIGPLGSLSVDMAMLVAAAAVLWLSSTAMTRAASLAALLAIPTAAVLAWHGSSDFESLWRGTTWIAGAFASVAVVAGLTAGGDGPGVNRLIGSALAVMLGVGAALLLRGGWQYVVEHAETVAYFEEHGEAFLASRGWSPDSPQAAAYERRLLGREASGWFGLANVYGGVVATISVALAGLLLQRGVQPSRAARFAAIGTAVIGSMLVLLNGGKGAIGALALGAAAIAGARWWPGRWDRNASWWRACIVAVPLVMLGAVTARFALGPEALGGERSLLMRGYYLDGAMRALAESPLGVGAGGFQPALLRLAAETCPEDAASVHHGWGDWVVAAGTIGVCWVALACLLAWWSTAPSRSPTVGEQPEDEAGGDAAERAFVWAIVAGAISLVATASAIDPVSLLVQVGSVAALAFAARAMAPWLERSATAGSGWRGAATITLSVVASLDMLHWHTGSSMWCWVTMGVMAGVGLSPREKGTSHRSTFFAVWASRLASIAALAAAVAALRWLPAVFQQERTLASTATMIARAAADGTRGEGTEPLSSVRIRTSAYLGESGTLVPTRHRIREIAIEQALLGVAKTEIRALADDAMLRAHQMASDARPDRHRTVAEARLFAETSALMVARAGADPHGPVAAWEEVVQLSPRDARAWARLGDAHARVEEMDAAVDAWSEALRRDDQQWLDPVRQFSPRERAKVQHKIDEATIPAALRAAPAPLP